MKISKKLWITIIFIGCIAQLSADLYLPSLPAISKFMKVGHGTIQLTVTFFLLGLTFSQLIFGPLSEKYGRKIPLMSGLLVCTLGGLFCVLSSNIAMLFIGRSMQGLGAGSASVIARTIMRDLFNGKELIFYNSFLASASVIILALGPVLGGYIQHFLGWRFNFIALVLLNLIIIYMTAFFYKETIEKKTTIINMLGFYKVLCNRTFLRHCLNCNLAYAGIIAWLTATPIILQESMNYSPTDCKWLYLSSGCGFFIGTITCRKLLKSWDSKTILSYASIISIIAVASMLVLSSYANMLVIALPIGLFMFSVAIIFPIASSVAMDQFTDLSGYASSILGSSQVLMGMLSSFLVSYMPETSQLPLSIFMLILTIANLIISIFSKQIKLF